MKVTKEFLRLVNADIKKALVDVAKKHGINSIDLGSTSYDDSGWKTKIEVKLNTAAEDPKTKSHLAILGLPPDSIGKIIIYGGAMTQYRITGIDIGKPKFAIKAQRLHDGQDLNLELEAVKRILNSTTK